MSELWYDAHRHNSFDYTRELILYNYGEDLQVLRERIALLEEQARWRDVSVDGYPEKAQDLLFMRDGKVVYGAWIGGRFWYNNEHVAVLNWMPLPAPLLQEDKP